MVAGGTNGSLNLSTAELYDPAGVTWTATGSMAYDRGSHTATLLPKGIVLVTGGHSSYDGDRNSCEIYTPSRK